MTYPKSENAKPVYFLLLKLTSENGILSRNFYWLHLPGADYKLLEPYRKKAVPLKITSRALIRGSTYELQMQVENISKKPASLLGSDITEEEEKLSLFQKIRRSFSNDPSSFKVVEIKGDEAGVAFFLQFSVHSSDDQKEGKDTRILPVHYSDNYFSLVPGESMPISISFEVPAGVTPIVMLHGWNYSGHIVH